MTVATTAKGNTRNSEDDTSALLHNDGTEASYGTAASTVLSSSAPTDQESSVPVANPELSVGRLAVILGSTYLGIILAALDGTMVATLTASISATFNSPSLLAWVASSYYIANSILQPLAGKLTDIYGRRAGLVFCHILFCVGNLVCGLASSENIIILGRVIAGLGGGGLNAIPLFMANDLVPMRRRGVWQGFNNVCFGVGSGLGGVFGGVLNDKIGWRPAFIILVPLTITSCALVAVFAVTPTKNTEDEGDKWKRIDFLGSLTLTTAILALLIGLNSGGTVVPWHHPLIWVSLPLSLILLSLFAYIECNIALEPVIPVRLLLDRTVASACLTSWFFSMAQIALTFYAPIFFQIQGKSAKDAGLLLIPTSIGAMLGGITTGIIIRSSGTYYALNIVVQVLFLLPLGLATRFNLATPVILPIIYFFCTGMAYAGKLTVTVTALIAAVPRPHQATITSASYAARGTGSAIGIAVCSLVFQNILSAALWRKFGGEKEAWSIVGKLRSSLREIRYLPSGEWMIKDALDAYMEALRGVFWTIFALAAVGTAASLFMREHRLHTRLDRD